MSETRTNQPFSGLTWRPDRGSTDPAMSAASHCLTVPLDARPAHESRGEGLTEESEFERARSIARRIVEHRLLESRCGVEFYFPWAIPDGNPFELRRNREAKPKGKATTGRADLRDTLSEAQNHRCCYCGVRAGTGPEAPTIEHVRPLSRGGTNARANLVMACLRCNGLRGSRDAYDFYERRAWEAPTLNELGRMPFDWQPIGPQKATLAAVWPRTPTPAREERGA